MARTVSRRSSGIGIFRTIERTGLRKGLAGNRTWFYVGTGLWTARTIRRMAERREEILISEPLRPGERIVIANGRATVEGTPAPLPRGRRARRKEQRRRRRSGADA